MLTQVVTAAAVASSAKQIAVSTGSSSGTVMYTVPNGKTFTGFLTGSSPSVLAYVNGQPVYCGGSSYYSFTPVPLTLVAGTIVTSSGNGGALIGVEQ